MTWELLLAIGGGIVLAGNVGSVIYKWVRPALAMHADMEYAKREIAELKQHECNDFATIKQMQEMSREQCRAMVAMMNHMVDGNHVDKMKETRDAILALLAEQ